MASLPLLVAAALAAAPDTDFFERKIRPVLAEKCYVCHSSKTLATSGLALDSSAGVLKGGSRGAAIVPGEPDSSTLIRAISYEDPDLKMPPTGKLTAEQIADFVAWVKMGAPDPRVDAPAPQAAPAAIDFDRARKFWSFQPVRNYPLPKVKRKSWPTSPIDHFILAHLEKKGLTPAPPADKRTLIRRATFDLIGLPPSAKEIDEFLADRSPRAFEKVVDRLLASPHYGERWARHWLDLVRFAETSGHEFDSDKPDAWRYRDYVIRAFNEDLPYDRFVREHIAGDLVAGGRPDSPLGTGYLALGEERNAADDIAEVRADVIDNQIDVITKTFLGLTVACARCHDHKFDPIPTADYYSLAGILESTRTIESSVDPPSQLREMAALDRKIAAVNAGIRKLLDRDRPGPARELRSILLKPAGAWSGYLEAARKEPDHVFYPFAVLAQASETPFSERLAKVRQELEEWEAEAARRGDVVFEDFEKPGFDGWEMNGPAFAAGPQQDAPPNQSLIGFQGLGMANSFGGGSDRLTGVLTSRSLRIDKPFLHIRLAGTADQTRRREHGVLRFTVQAPGRPAFLNVDKNGVFQWKTAGLKRLEGQLAYFVIADRSLSGHIAVDRIVLSDSKEPPRFASAPNRWILQILAEPDLDSIEALASAYQRVFLEALASPADDRETRWLAAALEPTGKPEDAAPAPELAALQKQRAEVEAAVPEAGFGPTARDDTPRNAAIRIRGNPHSLGPETPRRFLQVLGGQDCSRGSGRADLAEAIASPANPLTARVIVNRVWKHHFGQGLVRSADNFGATGERPTHPELLGSLAFRFVQGGWSLKALHRTLVLSSMYKMSGPGEFPAAMPARRLEAEAIRDSILAVAGTLDRTLYGPSVGPHISPYQDGRGKPPTGPLDGNGRRSIYIGVRRNFITPLFLAFDYPLPVTTIGQRGVSTVPSQALMMMNNEFVAAQAGKWAARVIAVHADAGPRIADMFVTAFGRPAEAAEVAEVRKFLEQQSARYPDSGADDPRVWTDLAHVLFNSKEFIFVR